MELNNEHIDDLIGKVLSTEANASERSELDLWIAQSEANKKYFADMQTLFSRSANIVEEHVFDTDAAWNKVKMKLNDGGKIVEMPSRKTSPVRWRIAAAVVTLLGLGVVLFNVFDHNAPQFAMQSDANILQDTLPDGSIAALNKKSTLTYEYDAQKNIRIARLSGEAFFEVKHSDVQEFMIETQEVFIKDIGTAFNVRSIPGTDTIEVYVKEGEVAFFSKDNEGLKLTAGERGIYIKSTKHFSQSQPEDENPAAYADREFRFRNTTLRKVIRKINEVYYREIELSNPELENCRITANFKDDDIETIASVIAETMGWNLTIKESRIILSGDKCE